MQTAEARLAGGTDVGFLLTVRQQVTLEVMVTSKLGRTVWTFVLLAGWGSCTLAGV